MLRMHLVRHSIHWSAVLLACGLPGKGGSNRMMYSTDHYHPSVLSVIVWDGAVESGRWTVPVGPVSKQVFFCAQSVPSAAVYVDRTSIV